MRNREMSPARKILIQLGEQVTLARYSFVPLDSEKVRYFSESADVCLNPFAKERTFIPSSGFLSAIIEIKAEIKLARLNFSDAIMTAMIVPRCHD